MMKKIQYLTLNFLINLYLFKSVKSCLLDEFECKSNKTCIKLSLTCNFDFDCLDFSDELNCSIPFVCPEGKFKCTDGVCTNADAKCNGIIECPDGSDENSCNEPIQVSPSTLYAEQSSSSFYLTTGHNSSILYASSSTLYCNWVAHVFLRLCIQFV